MVSSSALTSYKCERSTYLFTESYSFILFILTQSDLAARMQTLNVNIDQQMISKIEKNQRQVTDYELACFCKCLSVEPNEILKDFAQFLDF